MRLHANSGHECDDGEAQRLGAADLRLALHRAHRALGEGDVKTPLVEEQIPEQTKPSRLMHSRAVHGGKSRLVYELGSRMGQGLKFADFLLVGGGLASVTAAETLRAGDAAGSVAILSAEQMPPYHRPPLSKEFLLGHEDEARILIHPESFYRDHAIELMLDTRALSVDPASQIVSTAGGDIGYGQLLIATGGMPKPLRVTGSEFPGVFYLRFKGDAIAIRQAASDAKRAIVLGGSYLGTEIAMSLRKLGLDVTVVERGSVLLPYLEAPSLSSYFKRYAECNGLTLLLNEKIAALHGKDKVSEAETTSGRRLPCDFVVAAIGVSPASEFLAGSGIALENGRIAVDERLRTSAPNVYAAGDVTSFYDPVFARRRHIEHWDSAIKQGRLAAHNMLGRRLRYDEVSYFFADLGDVNFTVLGAPRKQTNGSPEARSIRAPTPCFTLKIMSSAPFFRPGGRPSKHGAPRA